MVKITRTEAAVAGPIMAAMLSGLPGEVVGGVVGEMVGVGVTITDSGAKVDPSAPRVSPDPDSEPSGRVVEQYGKAKASRFKDMVHLVPTECYIVNIKHNHNASTVRRIIEIVIELQH